MEMWLLSIESMWLPIYLADPAAAAAARKKMWQLPYAQ